MISYLPMLVSKRFSAGTEFYTHPSGETTALQLPDDTFNLTLERRERRERVDPIASNAIAAENNSLNHERLLWLMLNIAKRMWLSTDSWQFSVTLKRLIEVLGYPHP